ncbi:MAG: HAMP domain-containing methyl-accepting chemotaxis protein [Candidatus Pacebacteria bacterium]|nr:HAMP domain-containing methyl-accepting chemotaxis protein [Candidatus Paceibacterota bacterium]
MPGKVFKIAREVAFVDRINNLKLIHKVYLVCAWLMIPVLLLGYLLAIKSFNLISLTRTEVSGVSLIQSGIPAILNPNEENRKKFEDHYKSVQKKFNLPTLELPDIAAPAWEKVEANRKFVTQVSERASFNQEPTLSNSYVFQLVTQHLLDLGDAATALRLTREEREQSSRSLQINSIMGELSAIQNKIKILDDKFKKLDPEFTVQDQLILTTANRDLDTALSQVYNKAFRAAPAADIDRDIGQFTASLNAVSQVYLTELQDNLNDRLNSTYRMIAFQFGVCIIVLVLGLLAIQLVVHSIRIPLERVTNLMDSLAEGNVQVKIPNIVREDEIGHLFKATKRFHSTLLEKQILIDASMVQTEKEIRAQKITDMSSQFRTDTHAVLTGLSSAAEQLRQTASAMTDIAIDASTRVVAVAGAAEEVSANIGIVANASEGLVNSLKQVSGKVEISRMITRSAVEATTSSIKQIQELNVAAEKIGTIIGLINSIASQTNLLALNATIEAARAGEAGRGFAVVAGEVKSLASQTARATEEISTQIEAMQDATKNMVATIQNITETINNMDQVSTEIWEAVHTERVSTEEIAYSVQQAASSTNDVSKNITSVTKSVDQTSATAMQVLTAADSLNERTEILNERIEGYLVEVASV